jgi:Probable cobalt transporter subunit (CbtA)
MERKLIEGGIIAGALGGLVAFIFARVFAEPQIQAAIDYEEGRDHAQEMLDRAAGLTVGGHGDEIFTRAVQANVGLGVALIFFGMAMGALFAVVYAVSLGRTGMLRAKSLAFVLAGLGFAALYLVPFAKYPANPPAIGHEDTIKQRTWLYLLMVACSVIFMVLAVIVGKRLKPRLGTYNATIVAVIGFVVLVGIAMAILPPVGHLEINVQNYGRHSTETPLPLKDAQGNIVFPGFPADVLAKFRMYSVGAQLLMWTVLAATFAPIADRVINGKRTKSHTHASV